MGWLVRYDNDPLPYGQTPDSYLRGVCEQLTEDATAAGYSTKIIASSFVGRVWYAAAHVNQPAKGDRPALDYVTAFVFLTRGSARGGFGYKDMTESMGPYQYDCPARILDLLSPVEKLGYPGSAAEWRAACRARAAEKRQLRVARPKPGDVVRFAEPLNYSGKLISEFRIVERPYKIRGLIGERTDGAAGLYRIPLAKLATATIDKS